MKDLHGDAYLGAMIGMLKHRAKAAVNSTDVTSRYVWDSDGMLPSEGQLDVAIGDLSLTLDLRFPHERRYALGFLHGLRNPQADIDRHLFQKYLRHGDVVLDAGANIGVAAAEALACGASHIVCIEPEHAVARRLRALEARAENRMSVWCCALGARAAVADLWVSQLHNQGHTISPRMLSLFPSLFDGTLQTVEVTTIDLILTGRRADIWKVDVEGMEADVIRGACQTLERYPPRAIFAELYDSFVDEVVTLLPQFRVKRAVLTKANYDLELVDQIGGSVTDDYCPISPTYVFTRCC